MRLIPNTHSEHLLTFNGYTVCMVEKCLMTHQEELRKTLKSHQTNVDIQPYALEVAGTYHEGTQ